MRWLAMFEIEYMEYLDRFNKKVSRVGQCHVWDNFYEFDSSQFLDNGNYIFLCLNLQFYKAWLLMSIIIEKHILLKVL